MYKCTHMYVSMHRWMDVCIHVYCHVDVYSYGKAPWFARQTCINPLLPRHTTTYKVNAFVFTAYEARCICRMRGFLRLNPNLNLLEVKP